MIEENLRSDDRPNGLLPSLAKLFYDGNQYFNVDGLQELMKTLLKKQKEVYEAFVSRNHSNLETTTGQKMAVAMGLVDDVTTSTLQT